MWIRKRIVTPFKAVAKHLNKSKSIDPKIPEDAVNLVAKISNGQIVIEWQEKDDEQSDKDNSGSGNGDNKLADPPGVDAAE